MMVRGVCVFKLFPSFDVCMNSCILPEQYLLYWRDLMALIYVPELLVNSEADCVCEADFSTQTVIVHLYRIVVALRVHMSRCFDGCDIYDSAALGHCGLYCIWLIIMWRCRNVLHCIVFFVSVAYCKLASTWIPDIWFHLLNLIVG